MRMGSRLFSLPEFLIGTLDQDVYLRWLSRKARAHYQRDKAINRHISNAIYKRLIHEAVVRSEGCDEYTGEKLHWHLLSQYDNAQAKNGRRLYKRGFSMLPTVDHAYSRHITEKENFKICSWKVNDAKSDLTFDEFLDLCKLIANKYCA